MISFLSLKIVEAQNHLSEFGSILLFISGAAVFLLLVLLISRMLRPNRPNPEKLSTYESGEEPVSSPWAQFNFRFYIIALIFLLFEVEIVLLFPWATVFADKAAIMETNGLWGWYAVVEASLFVFVLALGLAYAWKNGFLDWAKPRPTPTPFESPVPRSMYDKLNERYENGANKNTKS